MFMNWEDTVTAVFYLEDLRNEAESQHLICGEIAAIACAFNCGNAVFQKRRM